MFEVISDISDFFRYNRKNPPIRRVKTMLYFLALELVKR
nr:MAG TPA: hypothetical protein [Caudoviricetes sp.]